MASRGPIIGFAACVLAVLGGLAWVTWHTLRLENLEASARARARQQEAIRLVLWRMDSALTPIIAREASRPYFEYQPFYPADPTIGSLKDVEGKQVLVPSPLLAPSEPFVRLYFQQDESAGYTSPQAPSGETLDRARSVYVTEYGVASARQQLESFKTMFQAGAIAAGGVTAPPAPPGNRLDARVPEPVQMQRAEQAEVGQTADFSSQNLNEYQYRQRVTKQAGEVEPRGLSNLLRKDATSADAEAAKAPVVDRAAGRVNPGEKAQKEEKLGEAGQRQAEAPVSGADSGGKNAKRDQSDATEALADKSVDLPVAGGRATLAKSLGTEGGVGDAAVGPIVSQGQFTAQWLASARGGEPELVFTRDVEIGEKHLRQGFWLDWPGLRTMLLESTHDLLPAAELRPVLDASLLTGNSELLGRVLAAIPVELIVPQAGEITIGAWTPVRVTLMCTWVIVLLAVGVIGLVLRASRELAERRGRFVSAVTHELRTPLTTFCLYSQMLADGMVTDGEAQKGYFATLKSESQRLARIVESVLDYARLSGKRTTKAPTLMTISELVATMKRPLAARCEQSGMIFELGGDITDSGSIRTDVGIVERIVFNLIDNACKYASEAQDRHVLLEVRAREREVDLTVHDHGPGIDHSDSSRLFKPFMRGTRHGHGNIPGLGLGLAIARGLAGELGGTLELVDGAAGAHVRLTIPRGL